jgi:prepilin-type N-terminal cleavage/methylation domain-containing protein
LTSESSKGQKGFTLIEVIVAIAVVAILAGVITPSVIKHIEDSRRARALSDCEVIGTAIASFYKDLGKFPNLTLTPATDVILVGSGAIPTATANGTTLWASDPTSAANADLFTYHLTQNKPKNVATTVYPSVGEFIWRGPYQGTFPADPWGNRYAANLGAATNSTYSVVVLSAGPDGIVQTAFNLANTASATGDDIIYRLK